MYTKLEEIFQVKLIETSNEIPGIFSRNWKKYLHFAEMDLLINFCIKLLRSLYTLQYKTIHTGKL